MLLVASSTITAFTVIGVVLALWALVLTALGVMNHDFPGKGPGQAIVMGISVVLVAAAISSAIITAKNEPKGGEEAGSETKTGGEGAAAPEQGGTPAPGTGANAGQEPGGQGQSAPPGKPAQTLLISADPTGQLKFNKDSLQAPAGIVRITMQNPSPVEHDVSIEGNGVDKQGEVVAKGGTSEVEADLKPGDYTFYCSVPGHKAAGMQGTLTVK